MVAVLSRDRSLLNKAPRDKRLVELADRLADEGTAFVRMLLRMLPEETLLVGQVDMEHWIWNEGIPADIAEFEGVRVVILGPPAYTRTWNTARSMAELKARVEVQEVLDQQQVQGWLARFASVKNRL